MDWTDALPPDDADFEEMARRALDALPEVFRRLAREVSIRVVDLADEATLDDLGIDSPYELTGLYSGIPVTEKSVMDQPHQPDTILLFRLAILGEWIDRGDIALFDLVAHVLVHELAHHFGWSDEDIAAIDRWWE